MDISSQPDCVILSSRIVSAPITLVYTAWSDPRHLQNWWGPEGFTNTFHAFDFREGGTWLFTMHGPDKGHYQNECVFTEIKPPHTIAWKRISKPLFDVLVQLVSMDEHQTKIHFHMIFAAAAECRKLKPFVVSKNEENFDKLERELALMQGI